MAYETADAPGSEDADDRIMRLVQEQRRKALVDDQAEVEAVRALGRRKGEKIAEEAVRASRVVRLTSLNQTEVKPVFWLWRKRIPLGEITLVAGKGGIGKSLFLCTLAAWITSGTMHGQFEGSPRDVIFIANEDSYEKTVAPRLLAAGADLSRVHRLSLDVGDGVEGKLILPTDCAILADAVRQVNAVAVILDPLSSNMHDKDRNSPEVRQSYERLRLFAETSNVAVIGNGHTRKGQSGDLLEAIMGSSEIGNVARAAIGIIRDPDAEEPTIIVSQCKNNYGPIDLASYTYTIKEVEILGRGIYAPTVVWGPDSERHVNDILTEPTSLASVSDVKDCTAWLHEWLTAAGPTPRTDVIKAGVKEGHKEHTIKRAAPRAGVQSRGVGFPRKMLWEIPASPAGTSDTGTVPAVPAVPAGSSRSSTPPHLHAVPAVPAVPTEGPTQDPLDDGMTTHSHK